MHILRMAKKRKPATGVIRPLDPSDPRSWDHPCHQEQWLKLAEELGRALARRHYAERSKAMRIERQKRIESQQAFDHPNHKKAWHALANSVGRARAFED